MTHAIEKTVVGRKPLIAAEATLDFCSNTYGAAPCNANAAKANRVQYSEQFDNAYWVKQTVTTTPNDTTAPDGTLTADKATSTWTVSAQTIASQIGSVSSDEYVTVSNHVKQGVGQYVAILIWNINEVLAVNFDLDTGTIHDYDELGVPNVTLFDAGIEHVAEGFYRIWATAYNPLGLSLNCRPLQILDAAGNRFGDTSGMYHWQWGAQYVPATVPGIYYKTEATAFTGTVGTECYNTRATCQDVPNYTKTTKVYRFCQPRGDLPRGINMHPVIVGEPDFTPVGAPVFGVGDRGKITLTLQDFPHNDLGVDPYVSTRSYDPESQGTFFGKWIARNPYYIGRTFVVKSGFITDPFSWDNFQDRTYVIERIDGPDSNGKVKIIGSDLLSLTDDNKAKAPIQTTGTYAGGLTSSPIEIQIYGDPDRWFDCECYGTSGYVRIGDEIYGYTGRTIPSPVTGTTTLTGVTRAEWGSTQADPEIGDTVQACMSGSSENVVDTVYKLLVDYAGVDPTKIPYTNGSPEDEWDIEKLSWLSGNNLTYIISEPTGVKTLLEELCEENQFSLYVDQINDKVKLVTNTPPTLNEPLMPLNDNAHLIENSISVKRDTKRQFTRVSVLYGMRDYTKDKDEETNYKFGYIDPDLVAEGVDQYDTIKEKRIFSRWFSESNTAQISQLAGRLRARFVNPPVVIHFELDAKDSSIWSGTLAEITTRHLQNTDGSDVVFRAQILTVDERKDRLKYIAMSSQFRGLYAYVKPSASPKVDYSDETEDNKLKYAHICPNTGLFNDGTPGYKII